MKKKRDIFAELTEGFDALKSQHESKLTPPPCAPTPAHLKTGSKESAESPGKRKADGLRVSGCKLYGVRPL